MKAATIKAAIVKATLGIAATAALFFAGTSKADAQVFVGFGFGHRVPPPVVVPAYPRPGFYPGYAYGYYAPRYYGYDRFHYDHRFDRGWRR
jgi:hypothetical protein